MSALSFDSSKNSPAEAQSRLSETQTKLANMEMDLSLLLKGVDSVRDYAIFFMDPTGVIKTWNTGAQNIKGYLAEEIIGQHFSRFYPEEALQRNHPAYELEVAARTGRFEEEGWRLRKDGSRFWANVVITAVYSDNVLIGYTKVTRDLSERREAKQRLRESEERYRLLVEGVKDYAIYMLSPEGVITSWNSGAERIKGYRTEEIVGRHLSIFFTPEDRVQKKPEQELAIAREVGRFEGEGWRLRKDGSRFWASVVVTALEGESGNLVGFSNITRDVTERKQTERQIQLTMEELQHSEARYRKLSAELEQRVLERTQRLAAANEELESFCFAVAHDLQAPLRKLMIFCDALEATSRNQIPAEGEDYLRRIHQSAQKMQQLLQALLELSRVTRKALAAEQIDLNRIVSEACDDLQDTIEETGASVVIEPLPGLLAESSQMRILFRNLLENALKYRREGVPPQIRIYDEPLAGEPFHQIVVEDNGIGFRQEYAERIFGYFERLHGNDRYPGTGMGLAICKKIVQRHGGSITAQSVEGQGTRFLLKLPYTA